MYTIRAIIPPYVFIEDKDGVTDRVTLSDFVNCPKLNGGAKKLETGKFEAVGISTDSDCVGGACPIK